MNDIELAWAAGLFDGEGSVGCYRMKAEQGRKRAYPFVKVSVGQAGSPEVLHRFRAAVGGLGNVTGPRDHGPRRQLAWRYTSNNKTHVVSIFKLLKPYLSSVKIQQFEKAFETLREWQSTQQP